jgi:photosystem II stability/assembly factor-like uncharacterized protein
MKPIKTFLLSSFATIFMFTHCIADIRSIDVSLQSGWNLISLPTEESVSSSYFQNYGASTIWTFDGSWHQNSQTLDKGIGFWVKMGDDQQLSFSGNSYEQDFSSLINGWNLLGTGTDTTINNKDISIVWTFSGGKWYQNPSIIKAAQGFWVNASIMNVEPTFDQISMTTTYNTLCFGKTTDILFDESLIKNPVLNATYGTISSSKYTAPSSMPDDGVDTITLSSESSTDIVASKNLFLIDKSSETKWIQSNGPSGGRTVAIDKIDESTYIVAANGGKIFKSVDNGESWQTLYDFVEHYRHKNMPVYGVAVSKNDPNIIYAILDRLYVSIDGGSSFTAYDHIDETNVLYKDDDGVIYIGTHRNEVFKIEDDKLSNLNTLTPLYDKFDGVVQDIDVKGNNITVISKLRSEDQDEAYENENTHLSKLYLSKDAGKTWSVINNFGNDTLRTSPNTAYISDKDEDIIYVGMLDYNNEIFTENDLEYLYKSSDGGKTWNSLELPWTDTTINIIGHHPHNNKLYISSGSTLFSSLDEADWSDETPPLRLLGDNPKAAFGNDNDDFILTCISGVVKGHEDSWENHTKGIRNVAISLLTTSDNQNIFATSPDGEGLFRSKDYGYNWENITENGIEHRWLDEVQINPHNKDELWAVADVGYLFWSDDNGDSFETKIDPYIGSEKSNYFRYSSVYAMDISDSGRAYALKNGFGIFRADIPKSVDEYYSWNFLNLSDIDYAYSIHIDPKNDNTLYVGSIPKLFQNNAFVRKSTDGGENFETILDIENSKGITSVEINPKNSNKLYIGNSGENPMIQISNDAGSTWTNINKSLNFSNFHNIYADPKESSVAYASAWGGGVYKTIDKGTSWDKMDSIPIFSVGAIITDPNNDNIIYLSDRTKPVIYKSTDKGSNWSIYFDAGTSYYRVLDLSVSKSESGVIYASIFDLNDPMKGGLFRIINGNGTLINNDLPIMSLIIKPHPNDGNTLYTITHSEGVYKSTNNGEIWTKISIDETADKIGFNDIVINPNNSHEIFLLGGNDVYFTGNGFESKNIAQDKLQTIYKSSDSGDSWTNLNLNTIGNVKSLIITQNNLLIAAGTQGIATSSDGGSNWSLSSDAPEFGNFTKLALSSDESTIFVSTAGGGVYVGSIKNSTISWQSESSINIPIDHIQVMCDPNDENTIYASSYPGGVFKSTDGGQTWSEKNFGMPNIKVDDPQKEGYYAFDIAKTDTQTIFLGVFGKGVYRSSDGANTWMPINGTNRDLQNKKILDIKIDPKDKKHILVSTKYSGVFESFDEGASWQNRDDGLDNVAVKLIKFDNNSKVYLGTLGNGIYRGDEDGWIQTQGFGGHGGYWRMWDRPLYQYTSILFDPNDENTLFIGTFPAGIYKSIDKGKTWIESNVGWTNDGVFSMVYHPTDKDTIYSGTYNGVNRSLDDGEHWELIDDGWPSEQWVFSIDFDKSNPNTMYACSKNGQNLGNGVDEFHGTVMKSTNGGESWFEITNGLNKDQEFYKIIVDKFDNKTLYLATQNEGIWLSLDSGNSWQRWDDGLGNNVAGTNGNNVTNVLNLSEDGMHLFYGTASSGVFRRLTYHALDQLECN